MGESSFPRSGHQFGGWFKLIWCEIHDSYINLYSNNWVLLFFMNAVNSYFDGSAIWRFQESLIALLLVSGKWSTSKCISMHHLLTKNFFPALACYSNKIFISLLYTTNRTMLLKSKVSYSPSLLYSVVLVNHQSQWFSWDVILY